MQYALLGDFHSHFKNTKKVLKHIKKTAPNATIIGLGDLYECRISKKKAQTVRNVALEDAAIISDKFESLITFPSIIGNQEERIALVTGLQRFLNYDEKIFIEQATLVHGHQFEWDEQFEPTFPEVGTPLLFFGHSHRAAIYINDVRRSVTYDTPLDVKDQPYKINVGSIVETAEWCLYDSDAMTVTFKRSKDVTAKK
ncbi:metallophosphoesterase family protein [Solibacillus sp. FSL H8-0538]|uniref:metallophosphoesterase family protein n=1 Tax=Solibacillus sp. FSL H8-0538 TaxID=2921400 RepID=UPI0030F9663A